jgi:phage terminase small subunit
MNEDNKKKLNNKSDKGKNKKQKLTLKQQKFIVEYVKSGDVTRSAIKAGYSKKTAYAIGSENLRKLEKEIQAYTESRMNKKIASADEVLEFLTKVMRGKIKEEQIVVEGIGRGFSEARIVEKHPTATDRLRAAKELAKRYGITPETVKINALETPNIHQTTLDAITKRVVVGFNDGEEDDDQSGEVGEDE